MECTPSSKDSKGVRDYLRCLHTALKDLDGVREVVLVDNGAKYSMVLYVEVKNIELLNRIMELVRERAEGIVGKVIYATDSTYVLFATGKEALILRRYA